MFTLNNHDSNDDKIVLKYSFFNIIIRDWPSINHLFYIYDHQYEDPKQKYCISQAKRVLQVVLVILCKYINASTSPYSTIKSKLKSDHK